MTVVTSSANAAVKAARKLAGRAGRQRSPGARGFRPPASPELLVEGPQAIGEALRWVQRLFVAEDAQARHAALLGRAREGGAEVVVVSDAVLRSISDTVTPQGIVAVAVLEEPTLEDVLREGAAVQTPDTPRSRLVVCLYEVADPGNAGTIVRTADACGADAVVLTAGSADVRNPKAVRASAGGLFHLPVISGLAIADALAAARRHGLQLIAAAARGDHELASIDFDRPSMLVFGSEAHGLPASVLSTCDVTARVPMHRLDRPGYGGHAESLNLAATVAMFLYEAVRQRTQRGRAVT